MSKMPGDVDHSRAQHLFDSVLEHQPISDVVDVLTGAGEMDELFDGDQ